MPDIDNYQVYNDRRRRSMWDKAFFMDKVPGTELIIDFGCADGSLIRFLHELFPSIRYIGYDIDPAMIAAARQHCPENAWFFSDQAELLDKIRALGIEKKRIAVNFSSVLHEIFHYDCDRESITRLIGQIGPGYLVVRDMMYASADPAAPAPQAAAEQLRRVLPAWQVADFEAAWGSIGVRKNLVHLILKYKYTENWERECRENYFSYGMEELTALLNPDGAYAPILLSRYILPWCRHDAKNTLGIDLGSSFTTHYSLILARRDAVPAISLDNEEHGGAYEQ